MDSRPKGLAFFRPLITLLNRQISSDMFLFRTMIINPESSPANAQVIFNRALRARLKVKSCVFSARFLNFINSNLFRIWFQLCRFGSRLQPSTPSYLSFSIFHDSMFRVFVLKFAPMRITSLSEFMNFWKYPLSCICFKAASGDLLSLNSNM